MMLLCVTPPLLIVLVELIAAIVSAAPRQGHFIRDASNYMVPAAAAADEPEIMPAPLPAVAPEDPRPREASADKVKRRRRAPRWRRSSSFKIPPIDKQLSNMRRRERLAQLGLRRLSGDDLVLKTPSEYAYLPNQSGPFSWIRWEARQAVRRFRQRRRGQQRNTPGASTGTALEAPPPGQATTTSDAATFDVDQPHAARGPRALLSRLGGRVEQAVGSLGRTVRRRLGRRRDHGPAAPSITPVKASSQSVNAEDAV